MNWKKVIRLGLLVWAKSTYSEICSYFRYDIKLVTVKSTLSETVSYFQFHENIQALKRTVKLLEIQKKKNLKARKEKNDYHKVLIIKEAVNLKTILSRQRYKNGNVKEIG